jgi:ABC-2 type transport system ATP-binding protein
MMRKTLTKKLASDNIALGQIIASGLTLIERGRLRIAGLSLTVQAGEIVGLVGDPGSGKSRSLALIGGMVEPTFGVVRLCGEPLKATQSNSVVGTNLTASGIMSVEPWLDELRERTGSHREARRTRMHKVLKEIGSDELIHGLDQSHGPGVRSILGLAAALASDSPVILIDEPMKGLTAERAKHVWKILRKMSRTGKAILISVDLSDLDSVHCDRLYLIENGLIARRGTLQDILGSSYTRRGRWPKWRRMMRRPGQGEKQA